METVQKANPNMTIIVGHEFCLLLPNHAISSTVKSKLHAQWITQTKTDPNSGGLIWWAVVTVG